MGKTGKATMIKQRTDKDILTPEDILSYIKDYEANTVPLLDSLWQYFLGKNPTIIKATDKIKAKDSTNPANCTPVSYARKIITTFTGYAYRPRYITYKSDNEALLNELMTTFNENNEHIKTSLNGRNTGIFGASYELIYMGESVLTGKPEVKFTVIDPREFILLYDFSVEPKKKIGIRFYRVSDELTKVEVYYSDKTVMYDMKKDRMGYKSELYLTGEERHFFGEVPIVAYYLGQEVQGLIESVIPLIDDYDSLVSGAMNEFDRFSNAYLRLVGMSLTPQQQKQLKTSRIFEQLKDKESVSFLTKDIPTAYIEYMTKLIQQQIHIQSHVPDLAGDKELSGVAIKRTMFDFENVVSSAEAEFDTGLYNRIQIVLRMLKLLARADGTFDEITISHKRNEPVNLMEFADISLKMSQAGFSRYSIVDIWPDDIFPDVEQELERQDEDREGELPDIESIPAPDVEQPMEEMPEDNTN